jgi:hypothetical protein
MVSKAWNQIKSLDLIHIMHFGPLTDLYGTPGAPKRAHFGPKRPFLGPLRSSESLGGQIWSQLPLIGPTQLVTWHPHTLAWYRPSSGPPGALKGPVLAQNVPFGAPEVPGRPLEDQIWLQCNYLDTPHGYIPTKNISGPKKGHFGPKLALLGPLGAQKRAETRSKCVVTMSLTLAEQPVAVRTKFCPRGPSWDLWVPKRDIWGQNWPFWGPRGSRRGPIPGQSVSMPCDQLCWTNQR